MTIFTGVDDFARQLCFDIDGIRRIAEARPVDLDREWTVLLDAAIEAEIPRVIPDGGRMVHGTIEFSASDGAKHRADGPAVIARRGSHFWFKNGKRHREHGPAVVWRHGQLEWLLDDYHHRIGGPAIIAPDGSETYLVRGALHRIDGPAVIQPGAKPEWYFDGKDITKAALAWMSKNNIQRLPLSEEEAFVLFIVLQS